MVEVLLQQAPWLTPTYLFLLLNLVIATILISSAFSNRLKTPVSPASTPLLRNPSLFSRVTSFNFSNYQQQQQSQPQHHQQNYDNSSTSFFSRVASFKFSGQAQAHSEPESVESATLEKDSREPVAQEINHDNSSASLFSRVPSQPDSVESATLKNRSSKGHVTKKAPLKEAYLLSRIKSFTPRKQDVQAQASEVDAHPKQAQETEKSEEREKQKEVEVEVAKAGTEEMRESKKRNEEEEEDAKADDFINRFKQQLKMQRFDSFMRYKTA